MAVVNARATLSGSLHPLFDFTLFLSLSFLRFCFIISNTVVRMGKGDRGRKGEETYVRIRPKKKVMSKNERELLSLSRFCASFLLS